VVEQTVVKAIAISHQFTDGDATRQVLDHVDLEIPYGELVTITGPSGSGKTTLLTLVGLLDPLQSGQLMLAGEDCTNLSQHERTLMRRTHLGFVYQFHNLMEELTARENVAMPLLLGGSSRKIALANADELLDLVQLSHRGHAFPSRLSGGERQRTAICRAIIHRPSLVIADEPTGNLDPDLAHEIGLLFQEIAKEQRLAVLMATHDMRLADSMDRKLILEHGRLKS
tara:strand:+ start:1142 stop:1822 length:681 start_codon:yes stop_codon:yes gene_type:complete